jgi:hypothetical protein
MTKMKSLPACFRHSLHPAIHANWPQTELFSLRCYQENSSHLSRETEVVAFVADLFALPLARLWQLLSSEDGARSRA